MRAAVPIPKEGTTMSTTTGTTTASTSKAEAPGAAVSGGPEPMTPARLMIAVADLTAHPGNVREDLNLTEEFLASVAAEGVRVPLLITPGPDGRWRVIEGHRRLAAAIQAGLSEVPCAADPDRAGDEAGQYLDMLLANSDGYRTNYTVAEEATALFAAHEAGASRTRLRKATGRTAAQVKTGLAAGGLSADTKARATGLCRELTLDDLALLAEFDGDEPATDRLLAAIDYGDSVEHTAERIRQDRAEAAEHARICAELETAGITLTDRLPDGAAHLADLTHDGETLTPDTHAACPGRGATFARWNPLEPVHYCADPAAHGHASRWAMRDPARSSAGGTGSAADADPAGTRAGPADAGPEGPADPDRRQVVTGNKAWKAAAEVRHRWLVSGLFSRRSLPRQAQQFMASQLLAMPEPLHSGLGAAHNRPLMAAITGRDARQWNDELATASAARLTVIALAPIVTAYEHAMTDGEGRNTWRTDRYSPCPRTAAGTYLTFLASVGYQLSDIEQAVADSHAWDPRTPLISVLAGGGDSPDGDQQQDGEPGDGSAAAEDQPAA
jgi:ParB family chromosome partitioning protein